jgi:hypothetical protein
MRFEVQIRAGQQGIDEAAQRQHDRVRDVEPIGNQLRGDDDGDHREDERDLAQHPVIVAEPSPPGRRRNTGPPDSDYITVICA